MEELSYPGERAAFLEEDLAAVASRAGERLEDRAEVPEEDQAAGPAVDRADGSGGGGSARPRAIGTHYQPKTFAFHM